MTTYLTKLVSAFFLILIKEIQPLNWKLFECNSNEIHNLNVSRLLLGHKDDIYLILDKKLIKFRSPRIYDEGWDGIYYSTFQSFELNYPDNTNGKIVGYRYIINENGNLKFKIEEVYDVDGSLELVELDFDTLPGSRTKRIRNEDKNDDFRFQFVYKLIKKGKMKTVTFEYLNNVLKVSLDEFGIRPMYKNFYLSYLTEYCVFYLNNEDDLLNGTLIEYGNKKVHFSNVFIKNSKDGEKFSIDLRTVNDDLDHFLSCHQPFISPSFVKGIVYSEKTDTFLIFVDKFYITTQDNLINNRFLLTYYHYDNKAFDIEFSDPNAGAKVEIVNTNKNSKVHYFWLSAFYQTNNHLQESLGKSLKNLFEIETYEHQSLFKSKLNSVNLIHEINSMLLLDAIDSCAGQIIEIFADDNKLTFYYCFESNFYYPAAKGNFNRATNRSENIQRFYPINRFSIHSLFVEAKFSYEEENLNQVFFYKHNKIVLMTFQFLYFLDERLLKKSSEQDLMKLTFQKPENRNYDPYNYHDLKKPGFFRMKNDFFLFSAKRTQKPSISKSTDEIQKTKIIALTILVIAGVIVFIFIGFFLLILYRIKNVKLAYQYCYSTILCMELSRKEHRKSFRKS